VIGVSAERILSLLIIILALTISVMPLDRIYGKPLPSPYNEFEERTFSNSLVFYSFEWKFILRKWWFWYWPWGFRVDEDSTDAYLTVLIEATDYVTFFLLHSECPEEERRACVTDMVSKFIEGEPMEYYYKKRARTFNLKIKLKPGIYIPIVLAEGLTSIYLKMVAFERLEPPRAPEPYDPQFMPTGIADYGVVEIGEDKLGYAYNFTRVMGVCWIKELQAEATTNDPEWKDVVGIQLNAVVHYTYRGRNYTLWVQNVVDFKTEGGEMQFILNIWNYTSFLSKLDPRLIVGRGNMSGYSYGIISETFYYAYGDKLNYTLPMKLILYMDVEPVEEGFNITFAYAVNNGSLKVYDEVLVKIKPEEGPYFVVDPSRLQGGAPVNVELVFTGPHGFIPRAMLKNISAEMALYVYRNGAYVPVPTAYSYGGTTYERVANVSVEYMGNWKVRLIRGNLSFDQVYYSFKEFPRYHVLEIVDPLNITGGVFLVEEGTKIWGPKEDVIDFGNYTRVVFLGYEPEVEEVREDTRVEAKWRREWYLEFKVVDEEGNEIDATPLVEGEPAPTGWVPVKPFTIKSVLWKGLEVSAEPVIVNKPGPYIVKAKLGTRKIFIIDSLGNPAENYNAVVKCDGYRVEVTTDENGKAEVYVPTDRVCRVVSKPFLSKKSITMIALIVVEVVVIAIALAVVVIKLRRRG